MTEQVAAPAAAPAAAPVASSDAAWVTVPARQTPQELAALSRDIEAIFRVNPYSYFQTFRQTGPDRYRAEYRNESNQQDVAVDMQVRPGPGRGLTVEYDQGIKKRTVFTIEAADNGSRFTITDDYEGRAPANSKELAEQADKSLVAWGEALRAYFMRQRRYGWLPGWRWYIRRLWIPMKPSARRIIWLLYLISVTEFFFFLFVLLIYVLELHK